jgi:hypothetical protein
MRLILINGFFGLAAGLYVFMENDRQRDREIAALRVQVNGLQLIASGQIRVPAFIGPREIHSKEIKY